MNFSAVCGETWSPPYLAGDLGRLGVGVAEHERGRGQDQQLAAGAAELGQPAFHVGVEGLPGLQRGVAGEDRIRRRGGEVAALVGVARLEDHRASLRGARHVELPGDVEERVPVAEGPRCRGGQELAGAGVGQDLVAVPGVPQLVRRGQEGPGPLVAVALGQVAAAAEVLPGEGVPGGDHVPRRPPAGEVVEAGELAGYLVRLVERGVDRAGQPDVLGHRGQGGQDREGVGPADHVEVVDQPVLLAQPQSFGEEQEVELASLGGLGELAERVELDMAAGGGVAPHGRVVHAGKVRGQVNLLGHGLCPR